MESVLDEHVPIPSDLAVQDVESVFTNFAPRLAASGLADIGGTVWLRTRDTPAAWSARMSDGRLVTERAADSPDDSAVTVTGLAQDIALLVWKRAVPPRAGTGRDRIGGRPQALPRHRLHPRSAHYARALISRGWLGRVMRHACAPVAAGCTQAADVSVSAGRQPSCGATSCRICT